MSGTWINGIGQISRSVADVEASRRWYEQVLQLPHLYTFGKLSFFDCGGTRLMLSQEGDCNPKESILYFRVDDIAASHPRLLDAGAKFLAEHLRDMYSTSHPESVHALDLAALRAPGISFWTIWDGPQLAGCGALKQLDAGHAEIKSMRTAQGFHRRGVATQLLQFMLDEARVINAAPAFPPGHAAS